MMKLARFDATVEGDCAIWCLSTLLGISYEKIINASAHFDRNGGLSGLTIPKMMQISESLGFRLRRSESVNLESDTGILVHTISRRAVWHVAVLKRGQLLDMFGDGLTIWDADVYITSKHAKVSEILILADQKREIE